LTKFDTHKQPAERRCIVSGETLPKSELMRFVVGPDSTLVADLDGDLPGRGLWVRPERPLLEEAISRNAFSRAQGGQVIVPDGFLENVERLIRTKSMNLLGLARRAGQVITGFDQVISALKKGEGGLILAALDGAQDGRRKVRGKLAAGTSAATLVENFDSAELSAAVGKENVVHVLVAPGKFAQQITRCARIVSGLAAPEGQEMDTEYKVAV